MIFSLFCSDWPINACCSSPDNNRLLCIVGDTTGCHIIDRRSKYYRHEQKREGNYSFREGTILSGHLDYGFGVDWKDNWVATANQDHTCRIWDLRWPSLEVTLLNSISVSMRTVQFNHDNDM